MSEATQAILNGEPMEQVAAVFASEVCKCNWCSKPMGRHSMLCPRYPQFGYDKSGNPHTEESYSKETAEGWRKFWSEKFAARDAAILKVLEGK